MLNRSQFGKSTLAGLLVGFVICGGIWVFRFVDGPVSAGGSMIDPNKSAAAAVKKPRFLQGLYVELQYPDEFDLISRLNTDKTALEQYNIGESAKPQFTMAISVRTLESGVLNDDSSWRSRSLDKTNYVSNNEQLQNETIGIMTKADKTEKTLFWAHKGKLLIIALSTNDPNDDLPGILATIKPTIKWRV